MSGLNCSVLSINFIFMNKIFLPLFLSFFSIYTMAAGYKSVSNDEFVSVLTDTSVVCLDVRTPAEFSDGHLKGALNIDVRNPQFKTLVAESLPKKGVVAVYCRSGRRSKMAADILSQMGYEVIELNTGVLGWTAAGKPLVK